MKIFGKRSGKTSVMLGILVALLLNTAVYAWYSVFVSAAVNEVRSGTLDVALEMADGDEWVDAEGITLNFGNNSNGKNEDAYWEPGCTYELPALRISNNGDIDLRYTVEISGLDGDAKLNEVIEWSYVIDGIAEDFAEISGELEAGDVSNSFTIRGHMAEEASNEYQGLSMDGIAVTVTATQLSASSEPEEEPETEVKGPEEPGLPYYNINTDTDLVIDEGGATIVFDDTVRNILASKNGQKITLSNATFTGNAGCILLGDYRSGAQKFNTEVNNVNVQDLNVCNGVENGTDKMSIAVYAYGTSELNDCVMTGTTSTAEGYEVYDLGIVNGATSTINGGTYGSIYVWSQAHVGIYDAEVETIVSSAITVRKLGMLTIGSGTHVGTIDLTVAGYYQWKPALTIEEGATVDRIIYRGVVYTQEEWLANHS